MEQPSCRNRSGCLAFVDITHITGGVRVVVAGELDMSSFEALSSALAAANELGGDVEVDLFGVSFIDSQALHALLAARLDSAPGRRFEIVDASPAVRRLLEVTRMDRLLSLGGRRSHS